MNRFVTVVLLLMLALFSSVIPALAGTYPADRNIVAYQESLVPAGQKVNNVLLIGKDGVIAGEVQDEVVVIKGSLTLKSTARIADRVFVIGGEITQEPGARVHKGVINIGTSDATVNAMILGLATFAGIEVIKLLLSISIVVAALIVILVAPAAARNTAAKLQGGLLKSAVLGILGALCLGLLTAALATRVWGIPLVLLVLLFFIVLLVIGLAGIGLVFGEFFKKEPAASRYSALVTVGTGMLLLVAILNLPVVGPVWGVIVTILALGAAIQVIVKTTTLQRRFHQ